MTHESESYAECFITHDGAYLLSHSIGLPVAGTRTAIDDYLGVWEADPAHAWPHWLGTIDGFRDQLARLIGGERASICPQSNVSSALTKILGALRSTFDVDTPTIVLTEEAFPSLGYVCERSGYRVRYIDRGRNTLDLNVWDRQLGDDVDVALITHVHSNTGELLSAASITEITRARGIVSVVDVAQSVGVIPINVKTWTADFIIGSCVKWLSGGPGAGWLWAAPEMVERCQPTDVGWFSHAEPFEFDIHEYRDAADALRFWGGSPTVLPFAVARTSIETIADIGVDKIRSSNLALTELLIDRLGDRVVSPHRPAYRSGTCIVAADAQCVDRLLHAGVEVDHRPSGLRVSPHVHTTRRDIEVAADLIASTQVPRPNTAAE
jgi:kynureninase